MKMLKKIHCTICKNALCCGQRNLKTAPENLVYRPPKDLHKLFKKINSSRHVKFLTEENQYDKLSESVVPLFRVPYEEQLELKQKHMRDALVRMISMAVNTRPKSVTRKLAEQAEKYGGQCCPLEYIKPSPKIYEYRNKDDFSVGCNIQGNKKTVGLFVGKGSKNEAVCVEPTHLVNMPQIHKDVCKAYQDFLRYSPLPACQVLKDGGNWKDLTLRSNRQGQTMALVRLHPQELAQSEIESAQNDLKEYFSTGPGQSVNVHSLYFQKCPHVFCTKEFSPHIHLHGEPYLEETVLGLKFRISSDSFFQTNAAAAEVLYSTVAEYADISPDSTVLDIYCGTGTIGILLSRQAKNVIGIEAIEAAVEDARFNANLNNCENTQFIAGDAPLMLNRLLRSEDFSPQDVIAVVNPGRIGMSKRVVRAIRRCTAIRRLVYVTCKAHGKVLKNFVELCIDEMENIPGEPFCPVKAIPVDMFPHTLHTELVMVFQR